MAQQYGNDDDCISAFKIGNKREAKRLLPHARADVTTNFSELGREVWGVTLLHLAAYHGWMDVVIELLTTYNSSANRKDDRGQTPLHYAANNGHKEVVMFLITKQKCDPMSKTNPLSCAWTPLHFACAKGHLSTAQYLISEQQCDPSYPDVSGRTPLHFACSGGHTDMVQYLLSTGTVDPMQEDRLRRDTSIDYARKSQSRNKSALLQHLLPFKQYKRKFPVHESAKLIFTRYSGTGKTTCVQEMAEVDEEDIKNQTAASEPLTIASGPPSILGESYYM